MDELEAIGYELEEIVEEIHCKWMIEIIVLGSTIETILALLKKQPMWAAYAIITFSSGSYDAEYRVRNWFPDVPEKQEFLRAVRRANRQMKEWRKRTAL